MNSILSSHSHKERIYFRTSFGIRLFFLVHILYFYLFLVCWVFQQFITGRKKKVIFCMSKQHNLERFLFTFRGNQSFFLFLHIKLSLLLLVYCNGTAGLKIKKQSLSRRHSAYTEENLWGALVIRVSLQSIHCFRQIHNFEYLIFLYPGVLWQNCCL